MAIYLPPEHPSIDFASNRGEVRARIGIINVMPQLELYEPSLLLPLAAARTLVEPVFIRLDSHPYQSSDAEHLRRFYMPFESALVRGLDGLILTGAPVEELAFEDVRYWPELRKILEYARANIGCTLGLCWGGLALAKILGIDKQNYPQKIFGVLEDRVLAPGHDLLESGESFVCAHSRHSGLRDDGLEKADVRLLSHGARTGYSLFESNDGRFVAHLGHPEYEAERLLFEWNRDRALGRTDVATPEGLPTDGEPVQTTWVGHRNALFDGLVRRSVKSIKATDAA